MSAPLKVWTQKGMQLMYKWCYDQKIFVILSETWAKQLVKIFKRYITRFLIYNWFSEIFRIVTAFLCTLRPQSVHKKAETILKISLNQL